MHWCLAYADMRQQVIYYLDSLGGNNQVCQDVLLEYLRVSSTAPIDHHQVFILGRTFGQKWYPIEFKMENRINFKTYSSTTEFIRLWNVYTQIRRLYIT